MALARRVWGVSPHLRAKCRPAGGCAPKRACGRSRRRASFWMPRKKPKRHRGEPQVELRPFGLVLHAVSPLDPLFYGGRQLGGMAGQRKGAGGVGIDVASPTAAAAWVGFPVRRFPRLRARLWHGGAQVSRWLRGGSLHPLERWLHPRRRRRGTPPSSTAHRTRAQWPGGSWEHPLRFPRAGTAPPGIRRIPP